MKIEGKPTDLIEMIRIIGFLEGICKSYSAYAILPGEKLRKFTKEGGDIDIALQSSTLLFKQSVFGRLHIQDDCCFAAMLN